MGGESIPAELTLNQNYPNPFNPSTQIKFGLPEPVNVQLRILNIRGETVRVLVSEYLNAGWHTVQWDSKDNIGRVTASGIYFYVLEVKGQRIVKRMLLMK